MIRYFVSYVHGSGFGWTDITAPAPITSPADLVEITRVIEQRGASKVTILSWRRFEDPE